MASRSGIYLALVSIFSLAAVVPRSAVAQHISVDGRFSAAQTLAGPNYAITASLGKQVGGNLFHSFGTFGLMKGESATFSGSAAVSNVIGRVTGGNPSSIDGNIKSTITGANLYLINPSSVIFGPNATVNVSGSFHASTADYLKMSDGARFQATNPDGSTLSAAPPAAFGFLTAQPAAITVNSSALGPVPGTLGLVGGPVSVTRGTLSAPAGTIHVASVAEAGEVPVDPRNTTALTVTSFGPVNITGGSTLNVSNPGGLGAGGSVFIRSGALMIDASEINADNYGSGPSGQIMLRGEDQVSFTDSANVHALTLSGGGAGIVISTAPAGVISADASTVLTGSAGAGAAGPLSVSTGQLTLTNGAGLASTVQGTGTAGPITINANSVVVAGSASSNSRTVISSLTQGSAAAADVSVSAGNLTILTNGEIGSFTGGPGNAGNVSLSVPGALSINGTSATFPTGIFSQANNSGNSGAAGVIMVSAGSLSITDGGQINADNYGSGAGGQLGSIQVNTGSLSIANSGTISASTYGLGSAGDVKLNVTGDFQVSNGTSSQLTGILASTTTSGNAGRISVEVGGQLSLDGGAKPEDIAAIAADSFLATGSGGNVTVKAGTLSVVSGGEISANAGFGFGVAGNVSVDVRGQLTIDGGAQRIAVISAVSGSNSGNSGNVSVHAAGLDVVNGGQITTGTIGGAGNAGDVSIDVTDRLTIDGGSISSSSNPYPGLASTGNAGNVAVKAAELEIVNGGIISTNTFTSGEGGTVKVTASALTISRNGAIVSNTFGSGTGGSVSVTVDGQLTIDGTAPANLLTGIATNSEAGSTGNAGDVTVRARSLSLVNGGAISSGALAASDNLLASTGNAGQVTVAAGTLSIASNGAIVSNTFGVGEGGSVSVTVSGQLTITGTSSGGLTGIASDAEAGKTGDAGKVIISAGALTILSNGDISSSTFGSGHGGGVFVSVPGQLTIDATSANTSFLTGIAAQADRGSTGNGGNINVTAGALSIANNGVISSRALGPSNGLPASTGNAGSVMVNAAQIALTNGGEIVSTTAGGGAGGSVQVTTSGALALNGTGNANTEIAASATGPKSKAGGEVSVAAESLMVEGGAQIASSTAGPGKGGNIGVAIAGDVTLSGTAANGVSSGITAAALPGSSGQAGEVVLTAGGTLALSGGAEVSSSTAGAGDGGSVRVAAQGPLTLTNPRSGITALAMPPASGNAGSVMVGAAQISVTAGAEIASTTAGTGAGGSVNVATPGALVLEGMGDPGTEIAASAEGLKSGLGGNVTVAAGSLTVEGGAEIASSTAGPGKGGGVDLVVASDIVLPDPGPQITARSTGSGDAGSITVSAVRLLMNNGATISTEAETSTANGGNITLSIGDFLYLVGSEITTSVKGETGNGGNITIDPDFTVLNHSSIIAQAVEGHGGNITINAGTYIASANSLVSASSQLGISGTVAINGPLVDLNGTLVVLSNELRSAVALARDSCASRSIRPRSSLTEAGRGGVVQDPDVALPGFYLAGHDIGDAPATGAFGKEDLSDVSTVSPFTFAACR